jgi:hypothetical protein
LSHPEELKRLNAEISSHLGHLGKGLVYVLGMVLVRHCGQTQIAAFLSGLVRCEFGTMKQRLREFTYAGEHKRGKQRQAVAVKSCFAPLLKWVLSKLRSETQQVVLALDATYLKERFVILSVSVVLVGCAIPVAWHIQKGDQQGKWNPIWLSLLQSLHAVIPATWRVYVLTDSGLYSKPLYRTLRKTFKYGAMMRVTLSQGLFKQKGCRCWRPLRDMVTRGMQPLVVVGICFKTHPIACTLVLQWDVDYDQPCLIVTNLPPASVQHNIYACRYWIECGFKDIKSGLLHWEQTKITCPQRAERLWLVISIALLWLTAVGAAALTLPSWQSLHLARPTTRILSAPVLGWIHLILALLQRQPLPFGHFNPYPWLPLPEE